MSFKVFIHFSLNYKFYTRTDMQNLLSYLKEDKEKE